VIAEVQDVMASEGGVRVEGGQAGELGEGTFGVDFAAFLRKIAHRRE
jgi:hypothetical protein